MVIDGELLMTGMAGRQRRHLHLGGHQNQESSLTVGTGHNPFCISAPQLLPNRSSSPRLTHAGNRSGIQTASGLNDKGTAAGFSPAPEL